MSWKTKLVYLHYKIQPAKLLATSLPKMVWLAIAKLNTDFNFNYNWDKYQPSSAGGTHSPPATPHRLQHLTARLIQNGRQGLEKG